MTTATLIAPPVELKCTYCAAPAVTGEQFLNNHYRELKHAGWKITFTLKKPPVVVCPGCLEPGGQAQTVKAAIAAVELVGQELAELIHETGIDAVKTALRTMENLPQSSELPKSIPVAPQWVERILIDPEPR